MYQRKESTERIIRKSGAAIDIRTMDSITIEDILMHQMKASGYNIITKKEKVPIVRRRWKDYLIKLYTLYP